MKKYLVAVCFLLLFATLVIAESANKFQLYTERMGFLGIGGKRTIMLDKETGDSWVYQESRWVSIPKVEAQLKAEEEKNKLEEEIAGIKAKQEAEIKALKDKQDAEINALVSKKDEPKAIEVRTETVRPKTNWRRTYSKPKVVAKAKVAPEASEGGEESPPAWLSE